jgi:energy-coupling factor transporter ATP-binding protein EcfA2
MKACESDIRMIEAKKGFVLWFTGLPSSGKTTLARVLADKLRDLGMKVELLDGDEVRKGLSSDLGFSKKDRDPCAACGVPLQATFPQRDSVNCLTNFALQNVSAPSKGAYWRPVH